MARGALANEGHVARVRRLRRRSRVRPQQFDAVMHFEMRLIVSAIPWMATMRALYAEHICNDAYAFSGLPTMSCESFTLPELRSVEMPAGQRYTTCCLPRCLVSPDV